MKLPLFALASVLAMNVQAQDHCYYEDGNYVSGNSIRIPTFVTSGTGWNGVFDITNISDKPIAVQLEFTDPNGNSYTPYSINYYQHFSSSNTPINLINGATLEPGQLGTIVIKDPAPLRINVGKLSWKANTCISEAVMATMYNQYSSSSRYDSAWFPLNNGQAF